MLIRTNPNDDCSTTRVAQNVAMLEAPHRNAHFVSDVKEAWHQVLLHVAEGVIILKVWIQVGAALRLLSKPDLHRPQEFLQK